MRLFPVMSKLRQAVPWALVEPWRDAAVRNHGQTLERLAERGGLSARELWAVAHGKSLREAFYSHDKPTEQECDDWLTTLDGVR